MLTCCVNGTPPRKKLKYDEPEVHEMILQTMEKPQQEILELKQQPKPENATEEPDHSYHISTSEVIETPSYKKLLDEFNLLEKEGKNGRNTLLILGPKGCGKTTSPNQPLLSDQLSAINGCKSYWKNSRRCSRISQEGQTSLSTQSILV